MPANDTALGSHAIIVADSRDRFRSCGDSVVSAQDAAARVSRAALTAGKETVDATRARVIPAKHRAAFCEFEANFTASPAPAGAMAAETCHTHPRRPRVHRKPDHQAHRRENPSAHRRNDLEFFAPEPNRLQFGMTLNSPRTLRRWDLPPVFRLACLLLAGLPIAAQSPPIAFTGAKIIPIDGNEIENGVVVVENGRIRAVGAASATPIPANAQRIDLKGKVLMPGLVDSHSHIGQPEGADSSSPFQPDVRVLDSVNPRAASIKRARAGGITTVNVMPGSGHLLSGQTLYLKLREARVIDDLLIRLPAGGVAGGIKMANGTNPRRATPFPGTRAKSAAIVREQFIKAQEYRAKVQAAGGDTAKLPPRDLRLEALVEALDGKRLVQHHTHRHDDILTVLRLAQEFNFKVVLHHVSDGWMVAREVAASKQVLGASVIVIDSPGGKLEAKDASFDTAGTMDRAGVLVGFHTDDGVTDSRWFLRSAALAVRAGMDRRKALESVTIANARLLALENRVGSLTAGKDADLIVLSGDPLSVYTHIEQTWVEGKKIWDRTRDADRLFATGGPGAAADGSLMSLDECGGFTLQGARFQ